MKLGRLTKAALLGLTIELQGSELLMGHDAHMSITHPEHVHEELQIDFSLLSPQLRAILDGLTLHVRTGDVPERLEDADHGVLLVVAKIRSVGVSSGEILSSGMATHFRVKNSAGIVVSQGPVLGDTHGTQDGVIALVVDNAVCVSRGTFVLDWH